jgi:hypothetical protein
MLDWERFMLEHTELDVLIVNYEVLSKVWLKMLFFVIVVGKKLQVLVKRNYRVNLFKN